MSKVYRDGQEAADATPEEMEALASAEGVYMTIEGDAVPLAEAVADLFDVLANAANHEPGKIITYKLEIYETDE